MDQEQKPTDEREPKRYEQKREEKERREAQKEQKKTMKRMGTYALAAAAIAGIIFSGARWVAGQKPQGPDVSQGFPIQGRDHIPVGSTHPDYNSNPPTSGSHYADPFGKNISDIELPDEQLIHNLEHGHIWISYHPRVPAEIVGELKQFVTYNVLLTPRSKNDMDIAVAAWGRLDKFNLENGTVDIGRIKNFIRRYANHGPESVPIEAHLR